MQQFPYAQAVKLPMDSRPISVVGRRSLRAQFLLKNGGCPHLPLLMS
jgi:hypothetical protein